MKVRRLGRPYLDTTRQIVITATMQVAAVDETMQVAAADRGTQTRLYR